MALKEMQAYGGPIAKDVGRDERPAHETRHGENPAKPERRSSMEQACRRSVRALKNVGETKWQ
jgi:hypothetical protein